MTRPVAAPREALREEGLREWRDLLLDVLAYARERDYRGPDYGDGMSSRLLQALPVESRWLNLAVQEVVKRAPVNVRPLLAVEQRRNFKGAALFAMANLTAAELTGDVAEAPDGATGPPGDAAGRPGDAAEPTGEDAYAREARTLVDWLIDASPDGYGGFCGCHRHDVQTLDGVVPAGTPGVVGTSYGVRALLRADERFDDDYAGVARTAADFLFEDLGYEAFEDGARIRYKPVDDGSHYTLNAVALGARILLDLYDRFREDRFRTAATELLRYVAGEQTDRGGWYYRDPPAASHLSMDNHHNGFVVETFQRYAEVVDDGRFGDTLATGLSFYRAELFEPDGAPNFDEEGAYPRDVHAAAQGVLVFTYAGDYAFAERVIEWTRQHLHAGDGRFYSQQRRWYTRRHVLMRWCEAWMAFALAEHLRARGRAAAGEDPPVGP